MSTCATRGKLKGPCGSSLIKKVHVLFLSATILSPSDSLVARQVVSPVDEKDYVGNVVGQVIDARTGQRIPDVTVILINRPWVSLSSAMPAGRDLGPLLLASSVRRGTTDARGRFLINRVPTPFPYKSYTVVALAPGYELQVFDEVPVFPGAVMSLECSFALTRGRGVSAVFLRNDRGAPYRYSHEKRLRMPSISQREQPPRTGVRLFATREGLVGRTTANGHVIRERDRFVALPSRRALCSRGGREFQVRLAYQGRKVVAPVWDVGPWNIRDDHWNPSRHRERWQDLPQGVPEAQAAFLNGYNGGRDEFGRRVLNPAGIDLADGTFWNDLRMRDNGWVSVEFLWSDEAIASTRPDRKPPDDSPRHPSRKPPARIGSILAEILKGARIIVEGTR